MYFGEDWKDYDDLRVKINFLQFRRCCYRYIFAKGSNLFIEQSLGHRDLQRENFNNESGDYKVWLMRSIEVVKDTGHLKVSLLNNGALFDVKHRCVDNSILETSANYNFYRGDTDY